MSPSNVVDRTMSRVSRVPTPSPARRVSAALVAAAAGTWVRWVLLTLAVVAVGLAVGIAVFGELTYGTWLPLMSRLRFPVGVLALFTCTALRLGVANGVTRRDTLDGLAVGATVVATCLAAVVALGLGVEGLVYAATDVRTPVTSVVGVLVAVVAGATSLVAYVVSGALIAVGYRRYGALAGTLVLVPAFLPAWVADVAWSTALGGHVPPGTLTDPLPGIGSGAATVVVAAVCTIAVTATGYATLRHAARDLSFPA